MARPSAKRGNPSFVSSSFYVDKITNINFNKALLDMQANGHELDRSDVIGALMKQWAACPHPLA